MTKKVIGAGMLAVLFTWLWAATAAAEPLPEGWVGGNINDYEIGTDTNNVRSGKAAAYIKSKSQNTAMFGTIIQTFSAENFRGKRVRMRAYVKTSDVEGWAGLMLRVDGEDKDSFALSFDNMQARPIRGTSDWQQYEIVLDVSRKGASITLGLLLAGSGWAWIDDIELEEVGPDVPVTGRQKYELPPEPVNLGFEAAETKHAAK